MLAAFCSSNGGRIYAMACQRWGVDPGAPLDDDVLALNLRVGLMLAGRPEEKTEVERHAELVDRARTALVGSTV